MKIVFEDIKFVVNEEKRIVTCIITSHLNFNSQQDSVQCFIPIKQCRFTVHGIAKCHIDDEFSAETGKRIAESRAKKMMYKKGKEKVLKILNHAEIFKNDVEKMIKNLDKYSLKEVEHIKLLSK